MKIAIAWHAVLLFYYGESGDDEQERSLRIRSKHRAIGLFLKKVGFVYRFISFVLGFEVFVSIMTVKLLF